MSFNFLVNQSCPRSNQALRLQSAVNHGELLMSIAIRNIFLAAVAASVLAGCQTTVTRECDKPNTKTVYSGKCCGVGDTNCREGKGGDRPGDRPGNTPDPTPQ
jgi:hypothetical protein